MSFNEPNGARPLFPKKEQCSFRLTEMAKLATTSLLQSDHLPHVMQEWALLYGDPLSLFLSFFFHSYSSIQVTTNDQSSRLLRYT